jgi:S-adenosylmethionine-diacylgycerolhomoserine-N-methlytransferase
MEVSIQPISSAHQAESHSDQGNRMQRYYQMQSKIYDWTRWSFLFGRKQILRMLPYEPKDQFSVVEIGCGTGFNLQQLARLFPNAQLTGIDVSGDMLRIAQQKLAPHARRVQLLEGPYQRGKSPFSKAPDVILFSYSLTMINPQFADLIAQAADDLAPGGVIAVVDFHNSPLPFFKRHMGNHHVRMDSHLPPVLDQHFQVEQQQVKKAYLGAWRYLLYQGRKNK